MSDKNTPWEKAAAFNPESDLNKDDQAVLDAIRESGKAFVYLAELRKSMNVGENRPRFDRSITTLYGLGLIEPLEWCGTAVRLSLTRRSD